MGKKKPRPRRSFTPELKAEIVELCRRGDRSVGQVPEDFDLPETAVHPFVEAEKRDGRNVEPAWTAAGFLNGYRPLEPPSTPAAVTGPVLVRSARPS